MVVFTAGYIPEQFSRATFLLLFLKQVTAVYDVRRKKRSTGFSFRPSSHYTWQDYNLLSFGNFCFSRLSMHSRL